MQSAIDQKIVDAIRLRDERGLECLLETYGSALKAWLLRSFGAVMADHEVQQAINDAALSVWNHIGRFDPAKASLCTWFVRIGVNCARDILRGLRRRSIEYCLGDDEPVWEHSLTAVETPLIDQLYRCIAELPVLQQAIILADLAAGGRAFDDRLAGLHNTSVGSIRVSRCKAQAKLKQQLVHFLPAHHPERVKVQAAAKP